MQKVTRREILAAVGAATTLPACAWLAGAPFARLVPVDPPGVQGYLFFTPAEARFVEAACECLIPDDSSGPGAAAAGVPRYLDRQLAGAWGTGDVLYREGSWQAGTPPRGPGAACPPARQFRSALAAILRDACDRTPSAFYRRPRAAQAAYLRDLESGAVNLGGVPSAQFFDMLLAMTVEGFFSDPLRAAARDRVTWRMQGFPGAHSARSAPAS